MRRIYRWHTVEGGGTEHLALDLSLDGIVAEGVVVGPVTGVLFEGEPFGCIYRVRCDPDWRVRELALRVGGGPSLALAADGEGHWTDGAGAPLPALDGCIDVDLACSPFTNTLPIRRLGEALRERQAIRVAFIAFPGLELKAWPQLYTRLDAGRYLFESPEHDFRAEIETDEDGLVLRYPGLFTRRGA
ncbi:putative glycolipid-binding domain-containing protein [Massilia sp. DD77]|uniref:putative glycolipid-binding domain-containing protein n=1 Tax=Massilia sp. DD77 TaxID=3109349 RepID=UPI003000B5E5